MRYYGQVEREKEMNMSKEEIVNGLKTIPGFGLLMSIDQLKTDMASVQNDVAYGMMAKRLAEWEADYEKYWK